MIQKTDGHYRNRFIGNKLKAMSLRIRKGSPFQISNDKDGVLPF